MECLIGGGLFRGIQDPGDQVFSEGEASEILKSTGEAIQYLHSVNIAHWDVQPENLLHTSHRLSAVLRLRVLALPRKPPATAHWPFLVIALLCGSRSAGPGKHDKSCARWSLRAIIYILLCGYPPSIPTWPCYLSEHEESYPNGQV